MDENEEDHEVLVKNSVLLICRLSSKQRLEHHPMDSIRGQMQKLFTLI